MDCVCKDYGHYTAHKYLDGKAGVGTAVHFSANLTLCVLNVKTSFGVGEEYDQGDDCEHGNDCDEYPRNLACAVFSY